MLKAAAVEFVLSPFALLTQPEKFNDFDLMLDFLKAALAKKAIIKHLLRVHRNRETARQAAPQDS